MDARLKESVPKGLQDNLRRINRPRCIWCGEIEETNASKDGKIIDDCVHTLLGLRQLFI